MLGEIVKMIQYYTDHNFPSQTILKKKWKLIFVWNYFFGKQPIKNKPYFYKIFPLAKDSFPLTNIFLHYQTLENVENYLYRKFSSETNKALNKSHDS